MNKKKSQEYLDKINQSFGQLTDPAFDIDIDSLLGYIRIFYSSVKSIPVEVSASPSSVKSENVIEFVPEQKNEIIYQNDPGKDLIFNEPKSDEIGSESAAPKVESEIDIPKSSPVEDEMETEVAAETVVEETEPLEAETEYQNDNIVTEPEIEEEIVEEVVEEKVTETEKVPEEPEIIETYIPEEIKTVIPSAEEREIKVQQEATVAREPEPQVTDEIKPTYPPVERPQYSEIESSHPKENILTQIEQAQKPLYTPDKQRVYNPSDAIESLFKEKSPTGLVDFLGLSPLDNLNKAWGLNEKMLVIKDLFNDDFNAFNDTVEMVNKLSSFEEVKSYLINNVVNKFQWNDLAKFKKAGDFIVQTKRLFVK